MLRGEDLRRELAAPRRARLEVGRPEGGELLLRARLERRRVVLGALEVVRAERDLAPVAAALLPQLLVLLELGVDERLPVVDELGVLHLGDELGHRREECLDALVELRGVDGGALHEHAQPHDAVVHPQPREDNVAELLGRAQLVVARLVDDLRRQLEQHRARPPVAPHLQVDLHRRVGVVDVGVLALQRLEERRVRAQRDGAERQLQQPLRGELRVEERAAAEGGEAVAHRRLGVRGARVAVAEGVDARVREERPAREADERRVRELRLVARVLEVLEDVPLVQLERHVRVVHGVLVRLLLEEVGVLARHDVLLHDEALRRERRALHLADDPGEQHAQLVRVAGEHQVEPDGRVVHAVVKPRHLGVVRKLGQLVGEQLREDARQHGRRRRVVRGGRHELDEHVRLGAAEDVVGLVPERHQPVAHHGLRQRRQRRGGEPLAHEREVGRDERVGRRQP